MSRNMSEVDEAEVPSVRRVCQDFMVREDGELAHRLQEEEFGHHYIRNRSERKTVREDVKAAKQTYLEEVKNAQILPNEELNNMEQTEQWLARDLQEKLLSEEACSERRKSELESRDEEIARQLQEKEALKLERARQRRLEKQLREEQETRMLQQAVKGLQGDDDNHFNHKKTEDIQRGAAPLSRSRNGLVDTVDISTQESALRGKKHSQTGRDAQKRYSLGEGAVVRLPANEGGRLESDRIIMADGTAIDLFDDSSDSKTREQAQKKSRERQDEEFARRLQEEEEQLVEQDRQAADDRKLALEFQDRELAKELQRREYIRLQKLKRERQLRRAQTVPSESSSGSTGELQAQQRLPSYEEAVHRNQIPDLLQDEPSFRTEQSHYRDDFAHRKYSSPERLAPSSKAGPFEQQRGAFEASSSRSHSSVPTSLDREQSCDEECVWSSHNSSPHSSLERSVEYSEQSQRSSSGSSHSSSQAQATFEHCQSPTSPDTREGVWERLYEEGEDIHHNSRRHRGMTRSYTVATSEPSKHSTTDITDNAAIPNRTDCNIAEFIDPTFSRRQQTDHEAGASSTSEPKPKSMPLIQPQRRQSSDKKKRDKGGEKDCKQQ